MGKGKFFICLKSYQCVIDEISERLNEDPSVLLKNDTINFIWN